MTVSDFGQASSEVPVQKTGAWSDTDIELLIHLWKEGQSNAEIAEVLGRQENAVAIKASRLRLPPKSVAGKQLAPENAKNSRAKVRPCLCCTKPFFSEGPGNRICDPCKSSSAWSSGDYTCQYGGNW